MRISRTTFAAYNVKVWLLDYRIVIAFALCFLTSLGGYYLLVFTPTLMLNKALQQEKLLKHKFIVSAKVADQLGAYQAQLSEAKLRLAHFQSHLPSEAERVNLLEKINNIGTEQGLQFKSVQWGAAKKQGPLTQLSLHIKVSGHYRQLGEFVEQLTELPSIIVVDNLHLISAQNNTMLRLDMVAKTYRYIEPQS